MQERRLRAAVQRAYQVPFYRSKWAAAGVQPRGHSDHRGPEKAANVYRRGYSPKRGRLPALWRLCRAGCTGRPASLADSFQRRDGGRTPADLYTPWDREVGNILRARSYYWQRVQAGAMW